MAQVTSAPGPATSSGSGAKGKPKSNEEIFAGFQALRAEQRQISNKITELEMDLTEHKIVIDTLKGVDPDRRCYRLMGGVLVERTVNDTLPELVSNSELIPQALEKLRKQLTEKGVEINKYIETHNIKIQKADQSSEATSEQRPGAKPNVLVSG